jgi:osmoprotectant transport system substrate-binding protein
VIRIASFDFTESEILAQLYGQALRANGYPVRLLLDAGTRELIQPALANGLVDLVPEYSGSALSFLTLGANRGSPEVELTHQQLIEALAGTSSEALAAAPAQDANAIVVTEATAARYDLTTISDLIMSAPELVFGGPPECPQRQLCLLGLKHTYGLRFKRFVPLDTGGQLTLQALRSGGIDVALLFTTDPAIEAEHMVVLTDDAGLQPAENVTPLVRRAAVARFGPALADTVDAVSAALTTTELRSLIGRVSLDGLPVGKVAAAWLKGHGLT